MFTVYKSYEPHDIDGYTLRIIVYGDRWENIRVDHKIV